MRTMLKQQVNADIWMPEACTRVWGRGDTVMIYDICAFLPLKGRRSWSNSLCAMRLEYPKA